MTRATRHHPDWTLAAMLAALAMLGPFSIDTYLPAFAEIGRTLHATPLQVQQTLSVYMLAYSAMMLWHGSISDAVGRRPVILVSLFVFAIATLGCAASYRIEYLLVFRALQGMSAGAGIAVGRAMIRDRFDGHVAQVLMSRVTMLFSIAPGIAPIIGGALHVAFGWHSIFLFVGLVATILLVVCWRALPETLPLHQRQSLAPHALLEGYRDLLTHGRFLLLVACVALNFGGLFLYISSAPVFLVHHLGLKETQFGYMFVPAVVGIFLGGWLSGRLAGKLTPMQVMRLAFAMLGGAALFNLLHSCWGQPSVWLNIGPLMVFNIGMSLGSATLTLLALECNPSRRGMVASLQASLQVAFSAVVSGVLSPWLSPSLAGLSAGMLVLNVLSIAAWYGYTRLATRETGVPSQG
ncbi:multidrug effflux MFS transporter [Leeia sp.]|uniref:multidrug effflux MFS transporter n=1 Tax=Leeia sp. TaxID=2884678 RepID=UPI0035B321D6